jgi:hypothetical protein
MFIIKFLAPADRKGMIVALAACRFKGFLVAGESGVFVFCWLELGWGRFLVSGLAQRLPACRGGVGCYRF